MRDLSTLLEKHNHEVAFFSMHDRRNWKTEWEKYFVSHASFKDPGLGLKEKLHLFARMLYSVEARRKFSSLLNEFKPDVIHIHNIDHHLSPSLLLEAKKRNIPIIKTVHDYHLIAPNRSLFHNDKICEITKPSQYYKAVYHRCIDNSYLSSLAEVLAFYTHHLLKFYLENIDYFIAPSEFLRKKLIEYGVNEKKIKHIPHFTTFEPLRKRPSTQSSNSYVLYVGRLIKEKGILFLLEVAKQLPNISFKIVGSGPEEVATKTFIRNHSLRNVELLPRQNDIRLRSLRQGSSFCILPSQWYEPFSYTILESFVLGIPVVATSMGGIPELIKDGGNGFLFTVGNVNECIENINSLWNHPARRKKMGLNAQETATRYSPSSHLKSIRNVYADALAEHAH